MGAADKYSYDEDQNRDYSDLSDQNQSALNKAKQRWGTAEVFDGGSYNPNSLENLENSTSKETKAKEEEVLSSESSPWKNRVGEGGGTHKSRNLQNKSKRFFGKMTKAKTIGVILFGGSTVGIGLLSTFVVGLMPIHIKEIMTEKLNSAATSMDLRTNKVLNLKMRYSIRGVKCTAGVVCKMSTVSERNIKNLEKAGFKVETEGESLFGSKKKIKKLEFTDPKTGKVTTIDNKSGSIKKVMNNNPEIRKAVRKGYSGRFASFLDKQWGKLKKWGKNLFKAKANNTGKSEDEIIDDINQIANNNADDPVEGSQQSLDGETEIDADAENEPDVNMDGDEGTKKLKETIQEAGDEIKGKPLSDKLSIANKKFNNFTKKVMPAIGGLALVCGIYNFFNMAYTAFKDTKVQIIAQFALSFLSYSDKMKAGHSTTEEVAAIGNSLMATHKSSKDSNSESTSRLKGALDYFADAATENNKAKSATDSQGLRALFYNDKVGELDDYAQNYSVGASGPFSKLMGMLTSGVIGWVARKGCKIVGWVALAISVTAAIFTFLSSCIVGGVITLGATCIWSLVKSVAKSIGWRSAIWIAANEINKIFNGGDGIIESVVKYAGQSIASIWMKDFVNKETQGEDYGNAIASGSAALMSKNARAGGAKTLTREEAVAFYQENEKLIAEYGQDIQNELSPFDPTTRHTFLGSIVSSIVPHAKSMASFANFIPSIVAISSRSLASILPGASAANEAGFIENMDTCKDITITGTGAATDIFCNTYTGIDTKYLEMESDEVIDNLIGSGQLEDDDSKDSILDNVVKGSDLEKYIQRCYNRKSPIGIMDEYDDAGESCNSTNNINASLFSVFLTDVRIEEGFDSDLQPSSETGLYSDASGNISGNAKNADCKAGELCWPIENANAGMITPGRWFHAGHNGYDFGSGGVTFGTQVFNIADGEVIAVGQKTIPSVPYTSTAYGPNILNGYDKGGCDFGPGNGGGGQHTVLIKHNINGTTYYSSYIHMQSNTQEVADLVGKPIKAGVKVGEVGSYGCSSGAHLHFSIHTDPYGGHIDPKVVLGELK